MSISYKAYLDTSCTPEALRRWLVDECSFEVSTDWITTDGIPMLVSDRGVVCVEPPNLDDEGPHDYAQGRTLFIYLDSNKQKGAFEFLMQTIGDVLQHCPGDAAVEQDSGGTFVLRRGETVWVEDDPFTREHLFASRFRPAKLVIGLPPPDKD